jgi:hypothetical protein
MKRIFLAGLVLATITATAAQAQKKVALNLAAGVTLPQGDLADRVDMGWHALATVNLSSPTQAWGLRFDVAHNRFYQENEVATPFQQTNYSGTDYSGRFTTTSATANLTYRLPLYNVAFSPYLITGLGAYVSECSGGGTCDAAAHYGWNIGLGTKLYVLGFQSFLEARFHRTGFRGTDVHYFPITFGISF